MHNIRARKGMVGSGWGYTALWLAQVRHDSEYPTGISAMRIKRPRPHNIINNGLVLQGRTVRDEREGYSSANYCLFIYASACSAVSLAVAAMFFDKCATTKPAHLTDMPVSSTASFTALCQSVCYSCT